MLGTQTLLLDEVYSVSRLTREIKNHLESRFASLWVEGEISNFRVPSSGHFYFTLKDENTQIRVVMFRSANQALPFIPEDGMQVTLRALLSVYAPRGEYQLIAEWMEPSGHGALQLAFEALKQKLAEEGLFDEDRKRPLPYLPQSIGLVTSPTGAAIRDVLNVLWRRFPNILVRLCPVRVQGAQAKDEIVDAIRLLNTAGEVDVIILGRGGGSLEDLWAFNEECVARAVSESVVPVVSAVGHEIDFTIVDFVADLRAPTPSAAAEMVVPEKIALVQASSAMRDRLQKAMSKNLVNREEKLYYLSSRMVHPGKRIQEGYVRLDELSERLRGAAIREVRQMRFRVQGLQDSLRQVSPSREIRTYSDRVESWGHELRRLMSYQLSMKRHQWREAAGRLESLSPLKVLARGYSIAQLQPSGRIIRSVENVRKGDAIAVKLSEGGLDCHVDAVHPDASGGK